MWLRGRFGLDFLPYRTSDRAAISVASARTGFRTVFRSDRRHRTRVLRARRAGDVGALLLLGRRTTLDGRRGSETSRRVWTSCLRGLE